MATKSTGPPTATATEPPSSAAETPPPPPPPPPPPTKQPPPPVKTEAAPSDANVIVVPSYSRWFSYDSIHECEVRHFPEFFDSASSSSKNPKVYKYYRNSIVKYFRYNPTRKITFTDLRKTLVGDVGSIRRVFDFLETWGLINFNPSSASNKPLKWDDKETKPEAGSNSNETSTPIKVTTKRVCSGCKALCTIACFACDKYDLTLCARCYVRGNYRVGVSSSDFRRVEISEESKTDWSEKESLRLLEAITHYGDDWKSVSQHVGGRTEKECVSHFLKLPFGDQFLHFQDSSGTVSDENGDQLAKLPDAQCDIQTVASAEPSSKRMRLTPLADASNPIMAQAAFLSALAGSEVSQAAALAAVATLSEVYQVTRINHRSLPKNTILQEAGIASNGGNTSDSFQASRLHANIQLEKEESDVEKAVSEIIVQMKGIQDKLLRFEDLDLLMDKESQQLEQIKNMLFLDELTLLFHKQQSASKTGACTEGTNVKTNC